MSGVYLLFCDTIVILFPPTFVIIYQSTKYSETPFYPLNYGACISVISLNKKLTMIRAFPDWRRVSCGKFLTQIYHGFCDTIVIVIFLSKKVQFRLHVCNKDCIFVGQ